MKRLSLFASLLLLLTVLPATAQHPGQKAANPNIEQQLIGTWEGPFKSDHLSGTMRLVIAKDTAWKVGLELLSEHPLAPSQVTNFKIDGYDLSWIQTLMGMSCSSSAVFDPRLIRDDALKGETSCGHGGLSFVLKKQ
jgi:hypothetical protein